MPYVASRIDVTGSIDRERNRIPGTSAEPGSPPLHSSRGETYYHPTDTGLTSGVDIALLVNLNGMRKPSKFSRGVSIAKCSLQRSIEVVLENGEAGGIPSGIERSGNVEVSRGIDRHAARTVVAVVGEMKFGYRGRSGCDSGDTVFGRSLGLPGSCRRYCQQSGKSE
jgi:hypothetical protein